jgi:hypothetical protein
VTDGTVGRGARLLGFAGLAPALAAVILIALGEVGAAAISAVYGLLILSFLGGIWWGFAMRDPARQGLIAAVAVLPTLAALALGVLIVASQGSGWSLVAIGTAILLTLPVDRWLAGRGLAPVGWMALRLPLSAALGGLTILAGVLVAVPALRL